MTNFLDDHVPVRARLILPPGLKMRGLYLGQGTLALELVTLDADVEPKGTLRQVWKDRLGGRAAPLLAVALLGDTAITRFPSPPKQPLRP